MKKGPVVEGREVVQAMPLWKELSRLAGGQPSLGTVGLGTGLGPVLPAAVARARAVEVTHRWDAAPAFRLHLVHGRRVLGWEIQISCLLS